MTIDSAASRGVVPTALTGNTVGALPTKPDLAQAAQQFEGILIRQMLAPLEKSLSAAAGGGNVPMVGGMVIETLGQGIVQGGGLGLADMIEAALRAAAAGAPEGSGGTKE